MADGQTSTAGPVTHKTELQVSISDHHESLPLLVTSLHRYSIILGIDWLTRHNPSVNWRNKAVAFNDPFCNKRCRSQCFVRSLSVDDSDSALLPDPEECVEFTFEDYYNVQLMAESYLTQDVCSSVPDLSCFSLSVDNVEEITTPVLPGRYAEFASLFKDREGGELPPHRPYDHAIPLEPGAQVPFGPLYTLSNKELEELRSYIDENLKKGYIRRSESPAGAPVLFVPKKLSEKLRLCVDYRALNKVTVKNRCPLPLISETLERLSQARIFTKLDLKGAYNLVRVAKGDEWKTAFRTRYGHFEYLVMPFGLTNAPATFQAFLNDVLRECLDTVVVIYLDDILIYSKDEESHTADVRRVLQLLSEARLQVNLEKCQFHVTKVEFLGYVISPEGISMDPSKVSAIVNWPTPSSVHDIQVFLGFANFYRRFIKNFSKVVSPMTRLLKKDVPFCWDDLAQAAFQELKTAFTSDPILRHYDPTKPCYLEPDASKVAIGAVVSQPEEDGILHPIAFYSRSLSPAERNYHIHDTELLAAIEGMEHWRHFFAYSEFPATVLTDHKNLEYFSEKRSLSPRQIRYAERLSRFNVKVLYRPGALNGAADALSRMHTSEGEEGPAQIHDALLPAPITVTPAQLRALFLNVITLNELALEPEPEPALELEAEPEPETLLARIKAALHKDQTTKVIIDRWNDQEQPDDLTIEDGLLHHQGHIWVPDDLELKRDVLSSCHDGPTAGHFGVQKTFELVTRTFYWPGLRKFVKRFVSTCDTCQRNKGVRHKPFGLLQPLPIPETPWSSLSMDFIVQLPESNGFTAILVIVDRFTKMAHFAPTTDNVDARGTVKLFMDNSFRHHGIPEDIVSDRGTTFTAQFTQEFMKALRVTQNLSTAFHPQTDGQTERTNATLEQYLRCFVNYQQDDWSELLPHAEFCYNNTLQDSIKSSPFYAHQGYHPRFHVDVPRAMTNPSAVYDRLSLLKTLQEDLKFYLTEAQEHQERYYNPKRQPQPDFQPGDQVWLLRQNIKTTRPADKLDVKRLGPFKILQAVNSRAFKLKLPAEMSRTHPVFHVSLLEPYQVDTIPDRFVPEPPPIIVDGQVEYEVESISDSEIHRKQGLRYLVKWYGYARPSWERAASLEHASTIVKEFHAKYPDKVGPTLAQS